MALSPLPESATRDPSPELSPSPSADCGRITESPLRAHVPGLALLRYTTRSHKLGHLLDEGLESPQPDTFSNSIRTGGPRCPVA